jgi:hypothetical protein
MTDVLGEMVSWGPETVVVQPDRGDPEPVEIPIADIVSGKPVPPRPAPRRPRS